MKSCEKTRELLIRHYRTYPKLQIQDLFKYLFQSAFGCEHMISSVPTAIEEIAKEYASWHYENDTTVELLDGDYCRVSLSYLTKGLCKETLGKLFCASAKSEPSGKHDLLQKLQVAREMVYTGELPFDATEFDRVLENWEKQKHRAIGHSNIFRAAYHPSYRVIASEYVRLLPLLARLDRMLKQNSVILAIEGGSASGKSTLGKTLHSLYDCTLFHMDDFFLRPEQRTPERFAEIGGNVDRERFLTEVLLPLHAKERIHYRRFDCHSQTLGEPTEISPKRLTVVEGTYSMHPELEKYYDLSVFLQITNEMQKQRIERRNPPAVASRFFKEWIPLEHLYFSKTNPKDRCDLYINMSESLPQNV